jgi:hypothetical protein
MKRSSPITAALVAMVFAVPAISLAAKSQENVTLSKTTTVQNSQLTPGDYKVVWEGTGPDVQVSFVQNKKTIATAPAKLLVKPATYDGAIETTDAANNSQVLTSIVWKKQSLVFTPAASNQQTGQ